MFYIYEWFIKETGEVIYVGKGSGNRYKAKKKSKLLNEMLKRFECDVRILKHYDDETEAFQAEKDRTIELKSIDQAVCNLVYGGSGGTRQCWTDKKRKFMSEHNPMKELHQRQRMSELNPMKNPIISSKVNSQKRRAVIINMVEFKSLGDAAKAMNLTISAICDWCKKGYNTNFEPCRYSDEEQKPFKTKEEQNLSWSKSVIVDGIKFGSGRLAAEYIGTRPQTLCEALKHNRPCKGHVVKYDNQQPSTPGTV